LNTTGYRQTALVVAVAIAAAASGASFAQAAAESGQHQQAGSSAGPGLFAVDEEAATRALERSLIQLNALLLAPGRAELGFDMGFGFDSQTSPILIELIDEATGESSSGVATTRSARRSYTLSADLRFGLPGDTQIDLGIPVEVSTDTRTTQFGGAILDNSSSTISGVADIQLSLLKGLVQERGRWPDIIARFSIDTDSASSGDGESVGSGSNEYTLGLTVTKRQDPLVFTFGLSHAISASVDDFTAGPVTQLSMGTVLAASPYTSLRFSFDQVVVGESSFEDQDITGSGTNLGVLSLGVSSVVSQFTFVNASLGVGLTDSGTDYSISIGISRRLDLRRR